MADAKRRKNVAVPEDLHAQIKNEILPLIAKVNGYGTNMEGFIEQAVRREVQAVLKKAKRLADTGSLKESA